MFANWILFATFCSMGTLVRRKKTWRYSAQKVMEFIQLMIDILVYVSFEFEMYIFKIAQVVSESVRFEFLYVLSIYCLTSTVKTAEIMSGRSYPFGQASLKQLTTSERMCQIRESNLRSPEHKPRHTTNCANLTGFTSSN